MSVLFVAQHGKGQMPRFSILGDFGGPLKSNGAPKTSQKNQYGDFWVSRSGPGSEKNRFWRVLENTLIFEWIFNAFWFDFGSIF